MNDEPQMDRDLQDRILREQIRLAMKQLPTMQTTSVIVALVLCYTVRDIVSREAILAWLLMVLAIVIGRISLYARFVRVREEPSVWERLKRLYVFLSLGSGGIWGLSAFLIFPAGSQGLIALFVLVMASLSATTTVSHASIRWGPAAWAGPAMLFYAVRCFLEGGEFCYTITFLIVLYLFTILRYSLIQNNTITSGISLKFENLELLDEVRKGKEVLEKRIEERTIELMRANERLTAESEERRLVADALRASEERYRTLYEENPSMYFTMDSAGTVLSVNRFGCEQLGYTAPELLGQSVLKVFHEEDKEAAAMSVARCTEDLGRVFHWELRKVRKTGEMMWVKETACAVPGPAGDVAVFIVCEDITERKQAEEALISANRALNDIIEFLPDATVVVDKDRNVVAWNRAMEEMTGIAKKDILGKADRDGTVPFYGEARRYLLDLIDADDEELQSKYGYFERKGDILNAEAHVPSLYGGRGATIFATATPLYDVHGNRIGAIESIRDITESKKKEEALRESQERFKELAELLPETIFEMEADGKITYVNQNAFDHFGFSQEDFEKGVNAFAFLSPQDRPRALENAARVMSGERIGLNEYRVLRKDGTSYFAAVHTAAKLHDGKPTGLRGIIIDMTETKRLEADLRQAHKMEAIGTLAGGIAHDFNNILAAIIGFTELALGEVENVEPAHHYLERVLKSACRAKDLVSQILASSRQRKTRERAPIEIAAVVDEALKLLRASLPTTIEMRKDLGNKKAMALADPTEVHQILVNLCTNAAHAMEEKGGVLAISLDETTLGAKAAAAAGGLKSGRYLRLTVADTGHGIAPAILDRIFDPYFTTKEVGKGSGLGLAVVQGIVKRHEGAITVSSEPGGGTRFHVYFPRMKSASAKAADGEGKPLPRGTARILFVDDEEILVEMGRNMLELLGYEVSATTSSVEALELFRSRPDRFDLVVSDFTMPHMTGADLAREIMGIRPDIPVILCTGFSERITEIKARDMGIRAFAMKPLRMREFAETVRGALGE